MSRAVKGRCFPNVPEIDKGKLSENTSFEQMHKNKKEGTVLGIINRPKWGWESRVKMKKLGSESLNRNVSVINEISNDNNTEFVSSKDKLVSFYVNARSIVYKMSELELYICEEKPDVIGITES